MSKRITLYQRLKPEAKAGLESIKNKPYKFSVDIIVFSGIEPKSVFDMKFGDFLFEPDLNEAP